MSNTNIQSSQISLNVKENKKLKIIMKSEYVATVVLEDKSGKKFIDTGVKIKKGTLLFRMNYLNNIIEFVSPCDCIVEDIFLTNNSVVQYGDKIMSLIAV